MSTAALPAPEDGELLLAWLQLIGWRVHIDRAGDALVGVATHVSPDTTLRVTARAPGRDALAGELFEAAMRLLEPRGGAAAAFMGASAA
jgi:hypothetical protein